MAPNSHWKAKVVVSAVAILLVVTYPSRSQSVLSGTHTDNISLSCKDIDVPEFVRQLKDITGLNFIYSTDRIDASHRISIAVHDVPLREVFRLVEKQTNLDFIKQGRYVLIKNGKSGVVVATPAPAQQAIRDASPSPAAARPEHEPREAAPRRVETDRSFSSVDSDWVIDRYFGYFRSTPDFPLLDYIPAKAVRRLKDNRKAKGWFASAGPFINDHATGVELHAGMPALHAIFQTGWLSNGRPKHAFGLGTTFPIAPDFSFSPSYSFSPIAYSEEQSHKTMTGIVLSNTLNVSARHQQVRFMLQYAPLRKINLRAGLSLNMLTASYHHADPMGFAGGTLVQRFNARYYNPTEQFPLNPNIRYRAIAVRPVPAPPELDVWLSWEAGISYRINFSSRP